MRPRTWRTPRAGPRGARDDLVGHGEVALLDFEALVSRDLELGLDLDDRGERTTLVAALEVLDLRDRDFLDLLGLDRVADILLEHRALRLVRKPVCELLADELQRHLARTEARQPRLAHESLLDFLDDRLHLLGVERDVQFNLALVQLLALGLH